MYWIEFIISATLIIYAGIKLTVYADALSDKLQLGKVWVGIVLLGLVTSLPEAITTIVAVTSVGANNLAVGNILGSNNFNPLLIIVMDIVYRKNSVTNDIEISKSHNASAAFACLLTLIVLFEIFFSRIMNIASVGPLTVGSWGIVFIYFIGMRFLSNVNNNHVVVEGKKNTTKYSLMRINLALAASTLIVVVSAIWLADSANEIARETGLGGTFVGSIFLAFVTSLPEMVVSISAIRLGVLGLAIGNIFGSNMTNIFILSLCDGFNGSESLLANVSGIHLLTGCLSLVLTALLVMGIHVKNKKTFYGVGWDSILMAVIFIIGTTVLYQMK